MNKKPIIDSLIKSVSDPKEEGVKTLLGDPKKAIVTLAIPMIIAMSAMTLYNVVDVLWVSGLGDLAIAATGFVFPFFFMGTALSTGLALGGGSAISRRIGARDKIGADNIAVHIIIILIISAVVFTILLLAFSEPIFRIIGATGHVLDLSLSYSRIIFAGSFFLFFSNVAIAIFRAEGDAKRSMYVMLLGSVLNIILDPVFIYTLDFGVAGAAWATIISLGVSSFIMGYWLFLKKDTFVEFKFKNFKFNKEIIYDILRVGIPSSFQQLSTSISMLITNYLIVFVALGGFLGIAVYRAGWTIATIAILPILGIATAVVSVCGAAYGEKSYHKFDTAYMHAVKIGLIIEISIAIITFILAPYIAAVYSTAEGTADLAEKLTIFLRIICIFYPGTALGIVSSSMFQGSGKGVYALTITLLRAIIFTTIFCYLLATYFNLGLTGIWWGIVVANLSGSTISFICARIYIHNLKSRKKQLGMN